MNNTYLLEIVRVLTPKVRMEMALFLKSPLYNGGSNAAELIRLYDAVLMAAPDFREEDLKKEHIFAQVYPTTDFITGKLEKLMVELNKLVRLFLLTQQYTSEKNEAQQQVDWLAQLRELGLINRAQLTLSKLEKQATSEPMEFLGQYLLNLNFEQEKHELKSIQNQVSGDLGIPDLIQSLDLYYHNYRIELQNRYLLQQKGIPLPELDLQGREESYYQQESMLYKLSWLVRDLLQKDQPKTEEFQVLLHFLKENEKRLPFEKQAQVYAYLRSLCTLLINSGQIDFVNMLHRIHQDNLNRGLFFINGELSPHSYLNIVQIAIRAKGYAWAKTFTETYQKSLIGSDKEQFFYRLNLSYCLFAEGKFEEVLINLPEPSSHPHYQGMVRLLELKVYYELRSDLLTYKLYAFRKYFERTATKSTPSRARAMYIEFFNIMLQLTQSPLKDKKRSERLVERIQKKKLLADRAWLLEKAHELA